MGFFDSFFGDGNNRGRNRPGDSRYDDFLDPRSDFWGEWKTPPHHPGGIFTPPQHQQGDIFRVYEEQPGEGRPRDTDGAFREHMQHFQQIFQGMNEIMNGIFPKFPAFSIQELPEPAQKYEDEELSPRDRMLKEPDSESSPSHPHQHSPDGSPGFSFTFPFGSIDIFKEGFGPQFDTRGPAMGIEQPQGPQVDKDLDDCDVNSLPLRSEESNPAPAFRSRSFFQSTSVRTYTTGDGTTRREVIKRDGMGNEERTVTETKDGQVTSVKTWTTKDGKTEVTDNTLAPECGQLDRPSAIQTPFGDHKNSIFSKLFSWSWKPRDD